MRARREAAERQRAEEARQQEERARVKKEQEERKRQAQEARRAHEARRKPQQQGRSHANGRQASNQGANQRQPEIRKHTAPDRPDRPVHPARRKQYAKDRRDAPPVDAAAEEQQKPKARSAAPSFVTAASKQREEPQTWGWAAQLAQQKPNAAVDSDTKPVSEPQATSAPEAAPAPAPTSKIAFGIDPDEKPEPYKPRYTESPQPAKSDAEAIHDILKGEPNLDSSRSSGAEGNGIQEQTPFQQDQISARSNATEYHYYPFQDDSPAQDDWQHLRRRQSEPSPSPEANQAGPPLMEEDDAWIDRRFAEHQQARNSRPRARTSPFTVQPDTQQGQQSNVQFKDTAKRVCGRCGQKGHVARQCTNPPTPKCFSCGEVGHTAQRCPTRAERASNRAQRNPPKFEGANTYWKPTESESQVSAQGRDDHRMNNPRFELMSRMRRDEPADDMSEEPTERVLKSRKFRDDEPRKEKAARRGRRGEEDEYDGRDERRSRRSRDFDVEEEDEGAMERRNRKAVRKEAKEAGKKAQRAADRAEQQAQQKNQIKLPEFISVQNLAQALGVRYEAFVTRLEDLGYDDVFPGKVLNTETSGMIAMEYDMEPVFEVGAREEEERDLKAAPEVDAQDKDLLPSRPPVVTIMGHVDHGKTTILDYLRKSSVAAGEAGGITQHIGAFSVPLASSGKTITFLDTPGHAAFLAMRQRGANVTDIVILVVAADDSVKPQTIEAIKHAKGANVPMLVAINKCDKEGADVQRVKQDLARHGVEIEDFGGDTQVVEVSGKTGQGMDTLEEATVTLGEILDHRADNSGVIEGWVLEATTKKAGRVATVLVRRGTLKQGSVLVAGKTWARVRSLRNEAGVAIKEAGPGMPVEIDGWRDQPAAGDEVLQAPTEQKATDVVQYRLELVERQKTADDMEVINEARRQEQEKKIAALQAKQRENSEEGGSADAKKASTQDTTTKGGRIEVPFIIKADVSGSAEAVEAYIMSVSSPMVAPTVLFSAVGAMNESDIDLAATTNGHIISFNLPSNEGLKMSALAHGVKVLENNIIYRVLDDVKAVLEEKLPPLVTQRVLGEAEIAAAFDIGLGGRKKMKIAGCKIRNGVIGHGARVRIMRGEEKIYDGTVSSLKNVKKDVSEMRKGSECGMGFEEWEDFQVGDQIQTYEEIREKRRL